MDLSWSESGARLVVSRFFERFIAIGCVSFMEEGGTTISFGDTKSKSSLKVSLRVHTPQFYWKVAKEADIGFAKAYINGDISFVDKTEGLLNFFLIIMANNELNTRTSKLNRKRGWWTPFLFTSIIASAKYFLKHLSSKNTLSQARHNIMQHYDLSNELFSLYLDETMTYSCAIFQTQGEDLKNAQLRKLHALIDKARIKKEHHVLEIGCGWGSLALEAVRKTGCKYTGITLSENQLRYAESKVKEAGLQDQIQLLLCDYRQLPVDQKYDRIISCEMIEHVGHEFMEEFFKCCESALAINGLLILQSAAIADDKYDEARLSHGFLSEYIFPGGCYPSLSRLLFAMAAGSRLSQALALGFNEDFIRKWEYYFDFTAAAFKCCLLGVYQIVFTRPGDVTAHGNVPYNNVPSTYDASVAMEH